MEGGHILKTKKRKNVKFRPLDDEDSTGSETETGHVSNGDARHVNLHPWLTGVGSVTSTHSSTTTVLEESAQSRPVGEKDPRRAHSRTHLSLGPDGSDLPDYSDHDVDITSDFKSARHGPGWTPRFLQNKPRLPKSHTKDLHITPLDDIISGAGRRSPSQNSRDSSKRYENSRWQAFWRDIDDRIRRQELSRINDLTT
jgi:hypothetical protein